MANIKLENKLITGLVDGKITLDALHNTGLLARHFSVLGEIYTYLQDYYSQNGQMPSTELVSSLSTAYAEIRDADSLEAVAKAIRDEKSVDIFYEELQRTLTLLRKEGNLQKSVNYLRNKLETFTVDDTPDVFDVTGEKFTAGSVDYEIRRKAYLEHGVYGIPSGFGGELDHHLNGGWIKGNLYGIAGMTSSGKSWAAMVCSRGGLLTGKKVFYLALEGTVSKEYYRLMTMLTQTSNRDLQMGALSVEQFTDSQRQMRENVAKTGGAFYLGTFGERDEYTPDVLRSKIERYKPDLVITDYLTLMADGSGQADTWETYLRISKRLKNFAVRYNIPVIAILQGTITNDAEKMENSNIAQSKGIARDFDWIGGITKVKGKKNVIRLNNMKVRDNEDDFDAFYQTGWNTGKIAFLEMVGISDGTF